MNLLLPALSGVLAFGITFVTTPKLIEKMKIKNMTGRDVNKRDGRRVAEMGGVAAIMGFAVALTVVIGIEKIMATVQADVVLGIMGVLFMTAFIGLIDDISVLSQKMKVILVAFAALPLVIVHIGSHRIMFPFDFGFTFPYHFYWIVVVPFAITGAANALNMSAGYNGLETGQVAIISGFLLIIAVIKDSSFSTLLVFSGLLGASLALYYYNRFPARTFVGDVGTLSMGAVIGAGVIIGNIQFYGVLLILPTFFELASTIYHDLKHVDRKTACRHPILLDDGKLQTPEGAKWYTLPYFILSRRPMREKELVNRMLLLYFMCGIVAVGLAVI